MLKRYASNKKDYKRLSNILNNDNNNTVNVILVTHDGRLRCFINNIIQNKNTSDVWFKNCCILKISLFAGSNTAHLELVYEGELLYRQNRSYFKRLLLSNRSSDNSSVFDVTFNLIEFPISKLKLTPSDITKNYNIFMVRHAESEHNLEGSLHITKDTLITNFPDKDDDGIRQSLRVANALNSLINGKVSYAFCSELKRSRQTLAIIMGRLNINNDMIVLPCSSELKYYEGGTCNIDNRGRVLYENMSTCVTNMSDPLCMNVDGYNVDWSYYNKLKQNEKNICENTNMIRVMFDVMSNIRSDDYHRTYDYYRAMNKDEDFTVVDNGITFTHYDILLVLLILMIIYCCFL